MEGASERKEMNRLKCVARLSQKMLTVISGSCSHSRWQLAGRQRNEGNQNTPAGQGHSPWQ